jgi:hypothetical protein
LNFEFPAAQPAERETGGGEEGQRVEGMVVPEWVIV